MGHGELKVASGARPGTGWWPDPAFPRPVWRGADGVWWDLVSPDGSW